MLPVLIPGNCAGHEGWLLALSEIRVGREAKALKRVP